MVSISEPTTPRVEQNQRTQSFFSHYANTHQVCFCGSLVGCAGQTAQSFPPVQSLPTDACLFFIRLTQAIFRLQSKHLLLNIHHSLSKPRQTQIFQIPNHLPPLRPVQPPKDKIVVQQLTQPDSLIQHMMEDVHQ